MENRSVSSPTIETPVKEENKLTGFENVTDRQLQEWQYIMLKNINNKLQAADIYFKITLALYTIGFIAALYLISKMP